MTDLKTTAGKLQMSLEYFLCEKIEIAQKMMGEMSREYRSQLNSASTSQI